MFQNAQFEGNQSRGRIFFRKLTQRIHSWLVHRRIWRARSHLRSASVHPDHSSLRNRAVKRIGDRRTEVPLQLGDGVAVQMLRKRRHSVYDKKFIFEGLP